MFRIICTERFAIFLLVLLFHFALFLCSHRLLFSSPEISFLLQYTKTTFRAHISFPYLYLNFHSCTESIVCRFLIIFLFSFFLALILNSSFQPFFRSATSFLLLHNNLYLCSQFFFNDIFVLSLFFWVRDSIFALPFWFFYFNYFVFLSCVFLPIRSLRIRKNRAKII